MLVILAMINFSHVVVPKVDFCLSHSYQLNLEKPGEATDILNNWKNRLTLALAHNFLAFWSQN